jgi:hypothetical protein
MCKCIYYILSMSIPFYKSILISCGCIPKLFVCLFFFFGVQWAIFISPSQKITMLWYSPNINIFLPMWDYVGTIPRNILEAHFALFHCLNITFISNIVNHHFWPKILQELRYLLWCIWINLVSCGGSQNINVLIIIFCNGPSSWPITKKLRNATPHQVEITFFIFFT